MSTEQFHDEAQYTQLEKEMSMPADDLPGDAGAPVEPPSHEPAPTGEPPPQQQQQQPSGYSGIPDQNEDPIGHFDARQRAVESHLQGEQFWNHIRNSEETLRNEFDEGDYDAACEHATASRMQELQQQYPDTHETAVLAYRHGFANPAQLRQAIFQHDVVTMAQHAMRNGVAPAAAFYDAARGRGYKTKTVMTKSFRRNVLNNIDKASDEEFDQFWKHYERAIKSVEQR